MKKTKSRKLNDKMKDVFCRCVQLADENNSESLVPLLNALSFTIGYSSTDDYLSDLSAYNPECFERIFNCLHAGGVK